jgi:hypothetical protein
MPTERLKFRCYRCNQLLASSPNKAGTVVSCPKCQADLLVPAPGSQPGSEPELPIRPEAEPQVKVDTEPAPQLQLRPQAEPQVKVDTGPAPQIQPTAPQRRDVASATATIEKRPAGEPERSVVNDVSPMIPPDLADLRPEDLRVEAEFFQSLTRTPPSPPVDPVPWPPPEPAAPTFSFETPISTVLPPVVPDFPRDAGPLEAAPPVPETPERPPRPVPAPSPPVTSVTLGPQIEIEPPTILPASHELGRIREVVLPASVVLAWSLFVLVGIALSFTAGLLMGHFIWRAP